MIKITFCGHSEIYFEDNLEKQLLEEIERVANGNPAIFYLGFNGHFDYMAKRCATAYKSKYLESKLIFVTPYLDDVYLRIRAPLAKWF